VSDGVINDRFATQLTATQGPGLQPPVSSSFGYNRDDDEDSYLSADEAARVSGQLHAGPRVSQNDH
jgi:hypothetical protein